MKFASSVGALALCAATAFASSNDDYALFGARHFPYEPFGLYKATLEPNKGDVKVVKTAAKADDADEAHDEFHFQDAFHRAQDRIVHSVEVAEKMLVHAVEEEVDTLFHDLPTQETQEVVQTSAKTTEREEAKGESAHVRRGWRIDEAVGDALNAMEEGYIE